MESLNEYNNRIDIALNKTKAYTGIECPNCTNELQYKTPGVYMMSNPMQADVKCFSCGYNTRIRVI